MENESKTKVYLLFQGKNKPEIIGVFSTEQKALNRFIVVASSGYPSAVEQALDGSPVTKKTLEDFSSIVCDGVPGLVFRLECRELE